MESMMNTTMKATVLKVCRCELLVCDHCTSKEVLVRTPKACCFCVGDRVCIVYSGAMTMSLPPQICAISICKLPHCECEKRCECEDRCERQDCCECEDHCDRRDHCECEDRCEHEKHCC